MSTNHMVKPGEHLAQIAALYGLRDWRQLWDAPENAELRRLRKTPSVLFEGDRVAVPEKSTKQADGSTQKRHRFETSGKPLELRLVVEDFYFHPIANARCELIVEAETHEVRTDDKGHLKHVIPATAQSAALIVREADSPLRDVVLEIEIGQLDPVDELSGQVARLNNLGYFPGPSDSHDEAAFRSAVEEFQCDHGLGVDGVCGPLTRAKLEKVHGC